MSSVVLTSDYLASCERCMLPFTGMPSGDGFQGFAVPLTWVRAPPRDGGGTWPLARVTWLLVDDLCGVFKVRVRVCSTGYGVTATWTGARTPGNLSVSGSLRRSAA
jgi:hypothetical protein